MHRQRNVRRPIPRLARRARRGAQRSVRRTQRNRLGDQQRARHPKVSRRLGPRSERRAPQRLKRTRERPARRDGARRRLARAASARRRQRVRHQRELSGVNRPPNRERPSRGREQASVFAIERNRVRLLLRVFILRLRGARLGLRASLHLPVDSARHAHREHVDAVRERGDELPWLQPRERARGRGGDPAWRTRGVGQYWRSG